MDAIRRSGILAVGLCVAALAVPVRGSLAAQDTGVLAGLVVDDGTGRPIADVKVALPALGILTTTESTGLFQLEGVRVGIVTVRFEAAGYMSVTEEIGLSAVEFLQVRLMALAAALDEIVVIAAGGAPSQRSSRVDVRSGVAFSTSVMDLLQDQIPGVTVLRGGGNVGGGGAAVTIRGIGTLQSGTAPDVYLDGVRLDGRDTGEHAMHILDRIPAAEVARIRVLKGAAATSAYPFSANGVIVIETHRGGEPDRS
jgi:outer membrane receptor protein involved in Fe transport